MSDLLGGDLFGSVQFLVTWILWAVFLGLKAFAFIDCLRRPKAAFPAIDRKSKTLWVVLTAVALLTALLVGQTLGIIGLAGVVIALIYLFDVRPKIQDITGRR
jgi:hypothetical protein